MAATKVPKLMERAHRAFGQKKFSLAEKYWTAALAISPESANIICNLGMVKAELGEVGAALRHFSDAIKKDPNCSRAYNNQAALLLRIGAHPQTILPHFVRALELSESYEDLELTLGDPSAWPKVAVFHHIDTDFFGHAAGETRPPGPFADNETRSIRQIDPRAALR